MSISGWLFELINYIDRLGERFHREPGRDQGFPPFILSDIGELDGVSPEPPFEMVSE